MNRLSEWPLETSKEPGGSLFRRHAWVVASEPAVKVVEGRPVCARTGLAVGASECQWRRKLSISGVESSVGPFKAMKKVAHPALPLDFRLGFVSIPGRKNVEGVQMMTGTATNAKETSLMKTTTAATAATTATAATAATTTRTTQTSASPTSPTMALTRRQRQIFDYISEFVEAKGYSPSLEEIAAAFGLSSVATVHKHVKHLVDKGYLRKAWNRSRSVEPIPPDETAASLYLPILGSVAAGSPIEAIEPDAGTAETLAIPAEMVPGSKDHYVLRVRGDSMIEEQICDGDLVVIEGRREARNGETVVALVDGAEATLKRFYRNGADVKLVPANHTMSPMEFHASRVEIRGVVRGLIRHF